MKNKNLDAKLDALITDLPKEYRVRPELWQQLETRLDVVTSDDATRRKSFAQYALVASIAILMLSSTIFLSTTSFFTGETHAHITMNEPMALLINKLNKQHQNQVDSILQSTVKTVSTSTTNNEFKTGIAKLKAAQISIIQELKKSPNNKSLWDLWLWTQAQELDLLKQHSKIQRMERIQSI